MDFSSGSEPAQKRGPSAPEIKSALLQRLPSLAKELWPNGAREGDEWRVGSIKNDRGKEGGGSCSIQLRGPKAGVFYDHATQERGDILDAISLLKGVEGAALFSCAAELVGLAVSALGTREAQARPQEQLIHDSQHQQEKERKQRATVATIEQWFKDSMPISVSPADAYFSGRRLTAPNSPDLAFVDALFHKETKSEHPAVVMRVRDKDKNVIAGHRLYLSEFCTKKIQGQKAKLAKGSYTNGSIRVHFSTLEKPKDLIIAEGVENALTGLMAEPDANVIAALASNNLPTVPVPFGHERIWIIADDEQENQRTGQKVGLEAAQKLFDRLLKDGHPDVRLVTPKTDKERADDLNDLAQIPGTIEEAVTLVRSAFRGAKVETSSFKNEPSATPADGSNLSVEPFSFKTAKQIDPPLMRPYLVKGLLYPKTTAMLYGQRSLGKSFVALDLCMAIARGEKWNERKVNQSGVVYLALEGEEGFQRRVKAYMKAKGIDDQDPPFVMVAEQLDIVKGVQQMQRLVRTVEAAQEITNSEIKLIVIDTLSQAMAGEDENQSAPVTQALKNIKILSQKTGACVMLVHHENKSRDGTARGHGGLEANIDTAFRVHREDEDAPKQIEVVKAKDDSQSFIRDYNLSQVVLGVDEEGDQVDSCIVDYEFATKKAAKGKSETVVIRKGSHDLGFVYRAVLNLIADGKCQPAMGAYYPTGRMIVHRDAVFDALLKGSLDPNHWNRGFPRAAKKLQEMGILGAYNNFVWLTGNAVEDRSQGA